MVTVIYIYIVSDISIIEDGIGLRLPLLLSQAGTTVVAVIVAMAYSWKLTLVVSLCIPISFVVVFIGQKVPIQSVIYLYMYN